MNFAEAMKTETTHTFTENGAKALSTTSNALVDLFGTIGALRERNPRDVEKLFAEAYAVDPLFATKILFYARDIREGCGERKVFRNLIKYLAKYHPEAIRPHIDKIGFYGRYDDLYELIGTPVEQDMWNVMKNQFETDRKAMENKQPISLLAKWIKTPDASSKNTRQLGILTAQKLGYSVYEFKRILRRMRKWIDVVEVKMSANEWDRIEYSAVPSRAMMIYRNAFAKHDENRFALFTSKALTGEAKINSSTLYPYDIVEKYLYKNENNDVLEAQWRQLPDYVEDGVDAIVMADVSGSMYGRPMATSIGLAMYFAEHNKGAYHNMFMTFSSTPTFVNIKGETLSQKIRFIRDADWGMNTNLEAAFDAILDIAIENHIAPEDMPKSLIIVSDMEIDCAVGSLGLRRRNVNDWEFYDLMRDKFAQNGYEIPNVVFWNCESRNDVFHADANRKGVQLVSGQSATTFKQLMQCIGMTPVEMMYKVINSPRYDAITIDR